MEIADLIKQATGCLIEVTESNDPRSYKVNSDKLLKTGFVPKKTVLDAIHEMINAYKNGMLKDSEQYYNLQWMQKNSLY